MHIELLDTTITLARSFGISLFEIMEQDIDEVIMLINYFIWKADNQPAQAAPSPARKDQQDMIKVNNKTATGGWW